MNTTQNTQRIIATVILAVTAGLALSSCTQRTASEPVRQLTSAQAAELRVGLTDLSASRAEMYRDLAFERAAANAEHAVGLHDLAESRAQMTRDLAGQRAVAGAGQAQGMLDLAESRAEMSRDLAEQRLAAWTDKVDGGSGMGGPVR